MKQIACFVFLLVGVQTTAVNKCNTIDTLVQPANSFFGPAVPALNSPPFMNQMSVACVPLDPPQRAPCQSTTNSIINKYQEMRATNSPPQFFNMVFQELNKYVAGDSSRNNLLKNVKINVPDATDPNKVGAEWGTAFELLDCITGGNCNTLNAALDPIKTGNVQSVPFEKDMSAQCLSWFGNPNLPAAQQPAAIEKVKACRSCSKEIGLAIMKAKAGGTSLIDALYLTFNDETLCNDKNGWKAEFQAMIGPWGRLSQALSCSGYSSTSTESTSTESTSTEATIMPTSDPICGWVDDALQMPNPPISTSVQMACLMNAANLNTSEKADCTTMQNAVTAALALTDEQQKKTAIANAIVTFAGNSEAKSRVVTSFIILGPSPPKYLIEFAFCTKQDDCTLLRFIDVINPTSNQTLASEWLIQGCSGNPALCPASADYKRCVMPPQNFYPRTAASVLARAQEVLKSTVLGTMPTAPLGTWGSMQKFLACKAV